MGEENVRYKELEIEMSSDRSDIWKLCIECVERGNGMTILALLRSKQVLKTERCSQYLVSKRSIIVFLCTLFLSVNE